MDRSTNWGMVLQQAQYHAGPSRQQGHVHASSAHSHISPRMQSQTQYSHARSHTAPAASPRNQPLPPTPTSPPGVSHVQAIHDFDPSLVASTSQSNSNLYLRFRAGDLIRVHTRDERGWWDGEVANVGEEREGPRRGWFPSNYVREMGWDGALHRRNDSSTTSIDSPISRRDAHSRHDSIASHHSRTSSCSGDPSPTLRSFPSLPLSFQPILLPIVQSLSLLESSIQGNRKTHLQPATACVISAIRAGLAQADCLSKESETLTRWPVLARERKLVLIELSRLVSCARNASGTSESELPDDTHAMETVAKAARSVFGSAQQFFSVAAEYGVEPKADQSEGRAFTSEDMQPSKSNPLPSKHKKRQSTSSQHGPASSGSQSSMRSSRVRSPPPSNPRIQEAFRKASSVGDLRAARRRASSPPPPLPTAPAHVISARGGTHSPSPASTPMSSTFNSSSGSGRSSPVSTKSGADRRPQDHMASRASHRSTGSEVFGYDDHVSVVSSSGFEHLSTLGDVNKAIQHAEERLFSIIAALVGHVHAHHHHAHPSSHALLIETTRETVDSIRELLTVVEAVGRHEGVRIWKANEVEKLRLVKDDLYNIASDLVEAAEVVANAPFEMPEAEEEEYVKQKSQLLNATTSTLRISTECLRMVRQCVPGDGTDLDATPRPDTVDPRQSTPRPVEHAATLRLKPVGARVHTLSGLHLKATSLSQLQRRHLQDGLLIHTPEKEEEQDEEDEDEEVVAETGREEDVTLRPSVPFPSSTSRLNLLQASSLPGHPRSSQPESRTEGIRSRSSSLTSPAPPSRIGHHSPSRSADLGKFPSGLVVQADARRPSNASSTATDASQSTSASSHLSERWVTSASASSSVASFHATALGFTSPAVSSNRSSIFTFPYVTSPDMIRNSIASSLQTGDAPRTPETSHESPILGCLPPEGTSTSSLPRIAGLRIDVDATPVKGGTFPRPSMERSATAPLPVQMTSTDARFWVVAHDYDPREISFNSEGTIIGASLRVLVEKMTPHDGPVDPNFAATFWYTFRLFTTPMALLDEVIRRYNLQPPPTMVLSEHETSLWIERKLVPVRLRIHNFLKAWLDTHWRADADDTVILTLREFTIDVVSRTLPAMAPRLLDSIKRHIEPISAVSNRSDRSSLKRSSSSDRLRFISPSPFVPPAQTSLPPTPIISKSLHTLLQKSAVTPATVDKISITDFDTTELARQLTLIEWKLFAAVVPEELLQTGKKTIPELKALSTMSNQITGWVADGILNEQDSKKRAGLLKFYIKLAEKCLALNNFSTMFAVLAGLNSSTILRLKKTWAALSTKYMAMMDRLRGVIEHTKNHAAYRARLREVNGPCLPFLGLILTDITFTSDGNPDNRPSVLAPDMSLINQDKYNKLGKIAMDFARYQEPFNFHELEAVQNFLRRVLAERGSGSLDALYRKSLMLEPRSGAERPSLAVEKPGWLGVRGLGGAGV